MNKLMMVLVVFISTFFAYGSVEAVASSKYSNMNEPLPEINGVASYPFCGDTIRFKCAPGTRIINWKISSQDVDCVELTIRILFEDPTGEVEGFVGVLRVGLYINTHLPMMDPFFMFKLQKYRKDYDPHNYKPYLIENANGSMGNRFLKDGMYFREDKTPIGGYVALLAVTAPYKDIADEIMDNLEVVQGKDKLLKSR